MVDDIVYSYLGYYWSEIHTPTIDSLTHNGIRYTQFCTMSCCYPTRTSLLTGLYNQQAGIGKMTDAEDELRHLTENTVTLAEVLKAGGNGKWHVSSQVWFR